MGQEANKPRVPVIEWDSASFQRLYPTYGYLEYVQCHPMTIIRRSSAYSTSIKHGVGRAVQGTLPALDVNTKYHVGGHMHRDNSLQFTHSDIDNDREGI